MSCTDFFKVQKLYHYYLTQLEMGIIRKSSVGYVLFLLAALINVIVSYDDTRHLTIFSFHLKLCYSGM